MALQALSLQVAACIAHQAVGATVSQWLPAVGPAAMGAWSGYTTRRIGRCATAMFVNEADAASAPVAVAQAELPAATPALADACLLDICKLQALIGMARTDGHVCSSERDFIEQALADQQLGLQQQTRLQAMLQGKAEPLQGIDALAAHPDAAVGLLANLAVLAWPDGELHPAERLYLRRIGNVLGFAREDVDDLLTDASRQAYAVTA